MYPAEDPGEDVTIEQAPVLHAEHAETLQCTEGADWQGLLPDVLVLPDVVTAALMAARVCLPVLEAVQM